MAIRLSQDLTLPIDAATQTFAFIGRKGSGKTYGSGKLAELLIEAGVQVIILDTVGNWYGLRLAADGKSTGIDIPILGGLRGDIPIESTAGALIADVAADSGRSLIIDASQFTKADRQRFATAFGERVWRRKKAERNPTAVHLILEESQLIVPEAVRGDAAVMVGIYEEIIRLGRNYGIGVSMITQRPQSVNKEVLNQTECLLVFQVNGAHSAEADRHSKANGMFWKNQDEVATSLLNAMRVVAQQRVEVPTPAPPRIVPPKPDRIPPAVRTTLSDSGSTNHSGRLPIGEKKILAALIQYPNGLRREQLTVLTGYKRSSRDAYIQRLREKGYVDPGGNGLLATQQGIAALPDSEPLPTGKALQEYWLARLPIGERACLEILISAYPQAVSRESISETTKYKRSSRDAYLQRLSAKELVEDAGRGEVRASGALFESASKEEHKSVFGGASS